MLRVSIATIVAALAIGGFVKAGDVHAAIICQKTGKNGKLTVKLVAQTPCPRNFQILVDLADLTTVKTDVAALKTDVSTLKPDVVALKTDVSTLKPDVVALKTDVSTLKPNVTALKADVPDLQAQIDDLFTLDDELQTEIDGIKEFDVSEIYVEGADPGAGGFGSDTSNRVRRFNSIITEDGEAIEFSQSATEGDVFIIKQSGWYAVSANDFHSGAGAGLDGGISKNSSNLAAAGSGLEPEDRLCSFGSSGLTGTNNGCGVTTYLEEGDVLRLQSIADGTVPWSTWMRVTLVHPDLR